MEFANTYAVVALDAIRDNYRLICEKAGKPVMAVVKADAYGHGAVAVAQCLADICPFFGVACAAEALELIAAGITQPILVLGNAPQEQFPRMIREDIRVTVSDFAEAQALSAAATALQKTAFCHIAVDTGMSRIGFQATEADAEVCAQIARLPGIEIEGLFSHFAAADEAQPQKAAAQAEVFSAFRRMLESRGVQPKICHLDNSAGILHFGCQGDMARAGIVLYGLYPSDEMARTLPLKPALSWYSHVSQVKTLPAGRKISYGGTYVTERETVVATVPVGYADGYRRSLSNRFYVLIRGKRAPILGRVCMDQILVDATAIDGVRTGDEVVLLGSSGAQTITAEALAAAAESFSYEQVCDLSRRVTRVYIRDGKEVRRVNYLLCDED